MASHRRGLRPSQWPVRDLLGPDVAPGRLWDARIGAALAGLLACGAAVTVVLTSGDQAVSDQPAEAIGPGPQADSPSVPVPQVPALEVPPPVIALPQLVPAPSGPMVITPPSVTVPRITPPRSARPPHAAPPRMRQASTGSTSRSKEQTLADQVASAIEHREERPARHRADVGRLRVPTQRPADAAALVDLACADDDRSEGRRSGGRHRAPDSEVEHHVARQHHSHRDHEDRDHEDRDHEDRDHREHDRAGHEHEHRAHDHDDHRSGWSWFETADDDRPEWSWFETDRHSDEDDGHGTRAHGHERNDEVDEDAVSDRDDAEERDDASGEDTPEDDEAEGVADSE